MDLPSVRHAVVDDVMTPAGADRSMACPHCGSHVPAGHFCPVCRRLVADPTGAVEFVTFNRRYWGNLLEVALALVTLGIGWFIWLAVVAPGGQTPAKRLLNVYLLDTETGAVAVAGKVWLRAFMKLLALGIGAGPVDAAWALFDHDRQTLHDKAAGTLPIYAPSGPPAELRETARGQRTYFATTPGAVGEPASADATAEGFSDVAARLREVARLHEEGILTDEEYERKRADLVSKL